MTTFTSREHVIPASLGSFAPFNPTITARDGLVCDICNGVIFSPLETLFKEDSLEGIYGQRLNLQNEKSVIIRGNLFNIERLSGFGDDFFDQIFFFLRPQDGRIVPYLRSQIKLRRFQGGYRVFDPDALDIIPSESAKFKRIALGLQNLNKKDMAIFAETHEDLDRIIAILKRYGVEYKENDRRSWEFETERAIELHENYTSRLNIDLARVLAKIAFNYFAYCAKQSNLQNLLYSNHFQKIRQFVHDGSGVCSLKEIISSINEEPILSEERDTGERIIAHLINFRAEDGNIVIRMTFFGLPTVYKVELGSLPNELKTEQFGCGHAFNPFDHSIVNLSQNPPPEGATAEQIQETFGLMRRI